MLKCASVAPFRVCSNSLQEVQKQRSHLKKSQGRRSHCRGYNNRNLKCLGLTILVADTTVFDNVTILFAIRAIFLRTISNDMTEFIAAKTLQGARVRRRSSSLSSISHRDGP
ncbi:hypothetical protein I3842_01G199000 [Carya illinoinensis]|uniref:Uncharacterized protein n=1 Tax=Carya illinoinensis TaxID=32201 RepID=A0A922G5P5_CARIL|nr:hypothetical protein I3842_01G199000 [Carya illinoinensis]